MKIYELPPLPVIAQYVRSVIVVEHEGNADTVIQLPFVADGMPGIIFQQSDSDVYLNDATIGPLFIYGQTVKPVFFSIYGSIQLICYFFYPSVLHSFFNVNAKELTDNCIDISGEYFAKQVNLQEQLLNTITLQERLNILNTYILQLIVQNNISVNKSIAHATNTMLSRKGDVSLASLQSELNVTERTLQRMFDFHVGISPRLYGKICRFNAAYRQLTDNSHTKLSDVAYMNGYADQSHFIRVFKEFTESTPTAYLQQYHSR